MSVAAKDGDRAPATMLNAEENCMINFVDTFSSSNNSYVCHNCKLKQLFGVKNFRHQPNYCSVYTGFGKKQEQIVPGHHVLLRRTQSC